MLKPYLSKLAQPKLCCCSVEDLSPKLKDDLLNAAAWCMGDERVETIISDAAIVGTKAPFRSANSWLDRNVGPKSPRKPRTGHQRAVSMWDRDPSPVQPIVPLQAAPSSRKPLLMGGEGEGSSFTRVSMAAELPSPRSRKPSFRSDEGEGHIRGIPSSTSLRSAASSEITSPRSSRKPSLRSDEGEGLIRGIPSSTSLMSGRDLPNLLSRSPSVRGVSAGGGKDGKAGPMSRSSSFGQVHTREDGRVVHDL